ncbi:MAG: SDR family oxidoreductase [Candidatus Kapabacteria bacterium]|nr:SDR family oxidoreductase [Candidatus Kapabacteria bacterium]
MEQNKIMICGASSKTAEALIDFFLAESLDNLILTSSVILKLKENPRIKSFVIPVTDKQGIKRIALDERPHVIVNCAAMTDVDRCETDKMLAFELNAHIPDHLARVSKIIGAHFITFSTDYIFDGKNGPYTEEALPNPLSHYGKSKLAGENMCRATWDKLSIIRTNVVFGKSNYDKNDFIRWVAGKLEEDKEFKVISGQWCNPTYTVDLARAVSKLIQKKRYGIYNVAGTDWLNRYEIALLIADVFGGNVEHILADKPENLIQKAQRPAKGGLVTLKSETDLNIKFFNLRSSLEALKFKLTVF